MTIKDIIRFNTACGRYFFSEDTMKFFRSYVKLDQPVYRKNDKYYFISSECFDEESPDLFTVREFNSVDHSVKSVSKFQQFKTELEARRFINNVIGAVIIEKNNTP